MSKTIIISNRLPVKIQKEGGELTYKPSEGGLATGLGSIYKEGDNVWIGWPGLYLKKKEDKDRVEKDLNKENMHPVFLSEQLIKDYYEGFSNETLWPIFHYFMQYAHYDQRLYEAYVEANQRFCEQVARVANPGDTIWVHDYQLLLLPQMVRDKLPNVSIGFFQHIPFPSFEVFRMMPWRRALLNGMLGADLIGFHTYDDMRHFLSSVSRLAGISNSDGKVNNGKRVIEVDSFPMGIDYDKYASSAASPKTIDHEIRFRTSLGDTKLIISIDRLDYSKGLPKRLEAFESFLNRYQEYRGKVSLIMIVVPSRSNVIQYQELKEEVDLLVGRINGQFGRLNWTPVHYFYRSFQLESLSAFYRMAHVGMVTPMRDGMNLVCKEFIASKLDQKGVLILSEMAGASKELSEAILINPNDVNQMVEAIREALTMPEDEQIRHIQIMQGSIKKYNIHHWVKMFMGRLNAIKNNQDALATKNIDHEALTALKKDYDSNKKRLLFLDYDGTLTGFRTNPQQSKPDIELLGIIENLISDPNNRLIIISGRDKTTLESWLGHFDLDIIAEHGVWLKEKGQGWHTLENLDSKWKKQIKTVLEQYVDRTPGSFIEEKDYSLVWHYRKVETGLGELRTRELASHLKYLASNKNLLVLEGDMVVEIKSALVNKGKAAQKWLQKFDSDMIIAIGDDWTDEDTFKVMPDTAYTIKVGSTSSAAKFNVDSHKEVRALLKKLSEKPGTSSRKGKSRK
ncbi:MAG TPA: bifunctional alpha,alpha-trehalose-phosphate synthase (UDP-forming)/trehalose-phosphatase [Cytophagales bacterium]|jgi:trehalose 6-phosphate synthase/phosphatase|nr:bifunctional alpha,alpha-trehalose-phosphate synthase (UDP-forming)/trehalose-phosphatase [Cytophagales bacterium]